MSLEPGCKPHVFLLDVQKRGDLLVGFSDYDVLPYQIID